MTENKRFTFSGTDEEPLIKDNITGKEYPTEENSLMELLNELHEENQDLATKKEDAEYELLYLKEKYEEVIEENDQLKSFIKGTCIFCGANLRQQYIEKYGDIE